LLALRAVSSRPLSFFLDHEGVLAQHNPSLGTGPEDNRVYDSQDFFTLFNLVREMELRLQQY
jgi:hypothetical protein